MEHSYLMQIDMEYRTLFRRKQELEKKYDSLCDGQKEELENIEQILSEMRGDITQNN